MKCTVLAAVDSVARESICCRKDMAPSFLFFVIQVPVRGPFFSFAPHLPTGGCIPLHHWAFMVNLEGMIDEYHLGQLSFYA